LATLLSCHDAFHKLSTVVVVIRKDVCVVTLKLYASAI